MPVSTGMTIMSHAGGGGPLERAGGGLCNPGFSILPCPLSEASIFLTKTMIVIHLITLMFLRLPEERFLSRRNPLQI
jgi:hypothetical protein